MIDHLPTPLAGFRATWVGAGRYLWDLAAPSGFGPGRARSCDGGLNGVVAHRPEEDRNMNRRDGVLQLSAVERHLSV